MTIMMRMDWPGATKDQYDALRQTVNWEQDKAKGGIFHVAAIDESGVHITDVWDTAEDFQRFTEDRLMPAVQELGIPGEPKIEIWETHAVFAPAYE
ncbi:hypothetical protein AB0E63_43340 [Kribbella sp. NPDC026596]|uniref:hypothetical protein n=1 Tax=Kribbella sp. NPDC026596 TaxID=3155122 RepID=UPI0033DA09B5